MYTGLNISQNYPCFWREKVSLFLIEEFPVCNRIIWMNSWENSHKACLTYKTFLKQIPLVPWSIFQNFHERIMKNSLEKRRRSRLKTGMSFPRFCNIFKICIIFLDKKGSLSGSYLKHRKSLFALNF
jgi:hypothetical protein